MNGDSIATMAVAVAVGAVGLWILFGVIRAAVLSALRRHAADQKAAEAPGDWMRR